MIKTKKVRVATAILAACLAIGAAGCGKTQAGGTTGSTSSTNSMTTASGAAAESITSAVEGTSSGMSENPMDMNKTFMPTDVFFPAQAEYDFPYMGTKLTLPEALQKSMDSKDVAMLANEDLNEDGSHKLALLTWSRVTEEQRNEELSAMGDSYDKWEEKISRIGAFGMYPTDVTNDELTKLTRCDTHTELGTSKDGKFKYYMSVSSQASDEDKKMIQDIKTTFGDMTPIPENGSAFMSTEDAAALGAAEASTSGASSASADSSAPGALNTLSTTDIDGKAYTAEELKKYDLTMVNVFTTWCTACVQEIPDLEKLHQDLKDKGVNIVGIVADSIDGTDKSGSVVDNAQATELAKKIREKTGATYPFLKPDANLYENRITKIYALPETYFVDKNGNIVGETYSGSHSYDDWKDIIEKTLKSVKGE